jgi:hypothetical protein
MHLTKISGSRICSHAGDLYKPRIAGSDSESPVAKMKATLLTWVLPLLFAGAAVAYNAAGRIIDDVDCLACPCTDCDYQMRYYKDDVSTVHLPVFDLY